MATLNLTPDEFADIAILFLADKNVNPEKIATGNENFVKFWKKASSRIQNLLLKYYLDTTPQRRIDYKRIKSVFSGGKNLQTIRIGPDKKIKAIRKEKGIAKKLISKLLKKEELEQEEILLLEEMLLGGEDE